MNQLIFKFPFSTNYFEEDYYVSSNNFEAYKLIETWPKWPSKFINSNLNFEDENGQWKASIK